eukprot:512608-Hanusia_phi.AAC.2
MMPGENRFQSSLRQTRLILFWYKLVSLDYFPLICHDCPRRPVAGQRRGVTVPPAGPGARHARGGR